MMVDYTYYKETFKGNIVPENEFESYSLKAQRKVINRLNGDYTPFIDNVKNAICEVIDILFNQSKTKERMNSVIAGSTQSISSEKVGDWTRSYNTTSLNELEHYSSDEYINSLIEDILKEYLYKTGLLYLGVPVV